MEQGFTKRQCFLCQPALLNNFHYQNRNIPCGISHQDKTAPGYSRDTFVYIKLP